jgi:hypothetical protein
MTFHKIFLLLFSLGVMVATHNSTNSILIAADSNLEARRLRDHYQNPYP